MSLFAQFLSLFEVRNESSNRAKRSLVPLDRETRIAPPVRLSEAEVDSVLDEEARWFTETTATEVFASVAPERVDLN